MQLLTRPQSLAAVRRSQLCTSTGLSPRLCSPQQRQQRRVASTTHKSPTAAVPRRALLSIPPVIDIAPLVHPELHPDPSARAEVLRQIAGACETWGFFHVTSHGVDQPSLQVTKGPLGMASSSLPPLGLQAELRHQMRRFFQAEDAAVREAVRRTATNSRGEELIAPRGWQTGRVVVARMPPGVRRRLRRAVW